MQLSHREEIGIGIDEDLKMLVDLSNEIIRQNKPIVKAFCSQFSAEDPQDSFSLIKKLLNERMWQAPTPEELWGRHRETFLVHTALIVWLVSRVINSKDTNDQTKLSCLYILGWARGVLTYAHPKSNSYEDLKGVLHWLKSSEGRARAHKEDAERKEELLRPFNDYVRKRVSEGNRHSAPTLVNIALKLPEFHALKEAVTPTYGSNGIEKRAFIKMRKLQDIAREIIKGNTQ